MDDHRTNQAIRHFALHRIGGVELRVISDIEAGVIAITEVEEEVLLRYTARPDWPHLVVSLFVLSDLSPLQRQLVRTAPLPPGGVEALAYRPLVNVYDLADRSACHIFVNQTAMVREGYWGDRVAETALLAHEHAHPLAENEAMQAARGLVVTLALISRRPLSDEADEAWQGKLLRLLQGLADKLCLYAPREVFANDVLLDSGFADALYYLDTINVRNAAKGLQVRPALVASLAAEPALTESGRAALLAVADLKAHLDLALEIASFWRQGWPEMASDLERVLAQEVFPSLVPETAPAYLALSGLYREMSPEATAEDLIEFGNAVVSVLAGGLAPYGLLLNGKVDVRANP